ncbi:L,D-transpeptidase [Streptomyces sp. NPDC005485]|uniref:L,D-transpeptidase n=1 Tax=Streptomyces sp. NPDC005485 TaxID=3155591 RepID=UPI0033A812DC
MSDELTSQLKELAQAGEAPASVSGAEIRHRAVRRRRRRTAGAVAGACAATALALVLALNPGGDGTDRSPAPAASPTGTPTTPALPDVTVDLSRRVLTFDHIDLPISSGTLKSPTPTGRMTVTAKEAVKVTSSTVRFPDKDYTVKLPWVLELSSADGTSTTYIGTLTYDDNAPGKYERTNGWIGLRSYDAKWLYSRLRLGSVVDIEGTAPTGEGDTTGSGGR